MCDFLSVLISRDARTIWVGNLHSHSDTVELFKLKHTQYHELEWTSDDPEDLEVRAESNEREETLGARILRRFPTRDDLFHYCLRHLHPKIKKIRISEGDISLPKNAKLQLQTLDLSYSRIQKIPDGFQCTGDVDLSCCSDLTTIGKGVKIGGSLNLWNTTIARIPASLRIGKELNLEDCRDLRSLPANLRVGKNLSLSDTKIVRLPSGLQVGGDLLLQGCKLKSLPADLQVKGKIYTSARLRCPAHLEKKVRCDSW